MMSKDSGLCKEDVGKIESNENKILCHDCLFDDLKVDAFGFCGDCSHPLCQECCRTHKKSSATRGHTIKEYSDENKTPDQTIERNDETMSSDGKEASARIQGERSMSTAVEECETPLFCNPCLFDNENTEASAFCTNCVEYLCPECCRDHKKSKSTRDHNILKENMPKNVSVFKRIKKMTSCSDHPDSNLTHKCKDHKAYICVLCVAGSHRKCTSVTELVSAESLDVSSRLETIEQQMVDIRSNAMKVKGTLQENIESLSTEKGVIQNEMSAAIEEVIEKLQQLQEKEMCTLTSLTESEMSGMTNGIDLCNRAETEIQSYIELLETVKQFGDNKDIDIIAGVISGTFSSMDKVLTSLGKKGKINMKFKQNPILNQIRSVGKASIKQQSTIKTEIKSRESPSYSPFNESTEKGIVSSLSATMQQVSIEDRRTEDLFGMKQNVQRHAAKQSRQLQCDTNPSCIIGGFVLNGGYILLVDESNINLKLYTKNYKIIAVRQLEARPIDICRTGATTFAVIYKDLKELECFEIQVGKPCGSHFNRRGFTATTIKLDRSFKTKNENCRITMYDDRFALLGKTYTDSVVLEVRKKDNNMLVLSEEFNSDKKLHCDYDGMALCTTSSGIVVCHKNVGMACFSCNFTLNRLVVKWRINPKIPNIQRIISDQYGNLFVCSSTKTGSVCKIATSSYIKTAIATKLNNPVCLIGNYKMKEILVCCENDDTMYIFDM